MFLFLPLITGISIILQAGINRQSSVQIGLLTAVLLNSFVFFVLSLAVWLIAKKGWIPVPAAFAIKDVLQMQPWFLIPGILGFFIVLCMPLALQNMPASLAFGLSIATQLIMAVVWDYLTLGIWPTLQKFLGIGLLFVGSLLLLY